MSNVNTKHTPLQDIQTMVTWEYIQGTHTRDTHKGHTHGTHTRDLDIHVDIQG